MRVREIPASELNALVPGRGWKIPAHYCDSGPRDAPVAVLMPGVGLPMELMFDSVRALNAAGMRTILIENPGFGASRLSAEEISAYRIAEVARENASPLQPYLDHSEAVFRYVREEMDVTPALIVAHSMQGYVQFERLRQLGFGEPEGAEHLRRLKQSSPAGFAFLEDHGLTEPRAFNSLWVRSLTHQPTREGLRQLGIQNPGEPVFAGKDDPVFGGPDDARPIFIAADTCTTADEPHKRDGRLAQAKRLRDAQAAIEAANSLKAAADIKEQRIDPVFQDFHEKMVTEFPNFSLPARPDVKNARETLATRLEKRWRAIINLDPAAWAEAWGRIADRVDTTDAAAGYPRLGILLGQHDKQPQRDGVALVQNARDARHDVTSAHVEIVDGAGHVAFDDYPERFATGVVQLFETMGGVLRPPSPSPRHGPRIPGLMNPGAGARQGRPPQRP
ncbi:MAG: alpha/beta fold hydrolase [Corynebacteriales bacterium]|nr:alpha/beta fold hydrolase [Mycobacteriales bacterium]